MSTDDTTPTNTPTEPPFDVVAYRAARCTYTEDDALATAFGYWSAVNVSSETCADWHDAWTQFATFVHLTNDGDWIPPNEPTPEHYELATRDAGLGVGHVWTNIRCLAYTTYDPNDCTCDPNRPMTVQWVENVHAHNTPTNTTREV